MSYQDAVNAFAYRRAAQHPHFRRGPGPIPGITTITVTASEAEALQSEELLIRQPFSVQLETQHIDWHTFGAVMPNSDPAFKNHNIDYSTDALIEGVIVEGFTGSDVTPPEPDRPSLNVEVRCGTCGQQIGFLVSITDGIRGVLETGK